MGRGQVGGGRDGGPAARPGILFLRETAGVAVVVVAVAVAEGVL